MDKGDRLIEERLVPVGGLIHDVKQIFALHALLGIIDHDLIKRMVSRGSFEGAFLGWRGYFILAEVFNVDLSAVEHHKLKC